MGWDQLIGGSDGAAVFDNVMLVRILPLWDEESKANSERPGALVSGHSSKIFLT